MTHYIIVKLIDKSNIDKYISLAKPIYEEMVKAIDGLTSYVIIINKVNGKNNYKTNNLHKKLKEETEFLVEKKTIFDE